LIRVLFDTNIFISAFIFGGLPRKLLEIARAGLIKLTTSPVLLDELERKLRRKFNWDEPILAETRNDLEQLCDITSTTQSITHIQADPDDDRVLEAAIAGRADYIVSGDKHLLTLGAYEGIRILTVRQFLDLLHPPA